MYRIFVFGWMGMGYEVELIGEFVLGGYDG